MIYVSKGRGENAKVKYSLYCPIGIDDDEKGELSQAKVAEGRSLICAYQAFLEGVGCGYVSFTKNIEIGVIDRVPSPIDLERILDNATFPRYLHKTRPALQAILMLVCYVDARTPINKKVADKATKVATLLFEEEQAEISYAFDELGPLGSLTEVCIRSQSKDWIENHPSLWVRTLALSKVMSEKFVNRRDVQSLPSPSETVRDNYER